MSLLSPPRGSILWLLGHELRLTLRAVTGRKGGRKLLIVACLGLVALVATGGAPLARYLLHFEQVLTRSLVLTLDTTLALIFTIVVSQTLSLATLAFFERGDLELLLSSPLPPRRILAARAVAIAATPFLWFATLISIPVLPLAAMGQPRWLAAYPVLAATALLGAACGIGLAMLLFSLLGVRRTRTAGQLVSSLIGAGFFLAVQARAFLPDAGRRLFAGVDRWTHGPAFEPTAPLAWPARAVLGEPLPLLVLVAGAVAVFSAVAAGLGRRFSTQAAMAAGAGSGSPRKSLGVVSVSGFSRGPFAAILRKEFRLMLRDPTLWSQLLLRTLYVVPLTFTMLKAAPGGSGDAALIQLCSYAGSVAFLASQLSGSLAWICISAEDAPDLLTSAPVAPRLVRRAKLVAALIPVGLLLLVPVLVLAGVSPRVGACAALGAVGAAVSSVLVNLLLEKPAPRRAFNGRRESSAVTTVVEILAGLAWAAAAWLLAVVVVRA